MEPRHQVSQGGIELIKRFEGFRARAARLPDGRHVIGYGHTRSARAGAAVSESDADALLRYDLKAVQTAMDEVVFTPLNRNQADALGAFAFSVGVEAFRRSNVLRRVNEGDLLGAAAALESWRRAEFEGEPIVVDALIRRRAAEKLLFLTPVEGFIAAPSAVLKPELDYGALPPRPAVDAAEIVTPLDGEETAPERVAGAAPVRVPEPSPALIAAERVSQRLQALFADEPEPERRAGDDQPPELASDPASAMAGPASTNPEPELLAPPVPDGDDGPPARPADPDQIFDRRIARGEPQIPVAFSPAKESGWPYPVLAALSLGLFTIAIFIILRAQATGETLFGARTMLGTVLAVIGTVGVCTAVYHWLRTWGDGSNPPRDEG